MTSTASPSLETARGVGAVPLVIVGDFSHFSLFTKTLVQ
jgi:hypothetical protein